MLLSQCALCLEDYDLLFSDSATMCPFFRDSIMMSPFLLKCDGLYLEWPYLTAHHNYRVSLRHYLLINCADGDGVRRDISKGVKYLQLASHGGTVLTVSCDSHVTL